MTSPWWELHSSICVIFFNMNGCLHFAWYCLWIGCFPDRRCMCLIVFFPHFHPRSLEPMSVCYSFGTPGMIWNIFEYQIERTHKAFPCFFFLTAFFVISDLVGLMKNDTFRRGPRVDVAWDPKFKIWPTWCFRQFLLLFHRLDRVFHMWMLEKKEHSECVQEFHFSKSQHRVFVVR